MSASPNHTLPTVPRQSSRSFATFVWQVISIVILFVLLLVFADVLLMVLQPISLQPDLQKPLYAPPAPNPQTVEYWQNVIKDYSVLTRTLTISATATSVVFNFDVWIPRNDELAGRIISGSTQVPLVEALFGKVVFEGKPLGVDDFSSPRWEVNPQNNLVHSGWIASKPMDRTAKILIQRWGLPSYDILGTLNDARLARLDSPSVEEVTPSFFRFKYPSGSRKGVTLSLESFVAHDTSTNLSPQSSSASRQNVLVNQVGTALDFPVLGIWGLGLVRSLALVVFLFIISNNQARQHPFILALAMLTNALLLFRIILYLPYGFTALNPEPELISSIIDMPFSDLTVYPIFGSRSTLGFIANHIAPAILGILATVLLYQQSGTGINRVTISRGRWFEVLIRLCLIGGVVVSVTLALPYMNRPDSTWAKLPVGIILLFAGSVLTIFIWWVGNALYRQFLVISHGAEAPAVVIPGVGALSAVVILGMSLVRAYTYNSYPDVPAWIQWFWFGLAVALGFALLWAFARLILAFVHEINSDWTLEKWAHRGLNLVLVVFAIPMTTLIGAGNPLVRDMDVINLGYSLDDIVLPIWLAGILWFLYLNGKSESNKAQPLDPLIRALGILGASTLFFDPFGRWLYIPITFLLGWFFLSRFVRPAAYWEKLKPLIQPVFHDRSKLLARIIQLNALENAEKEFRKKQIGKLTADEITPEEYHKKIEEHHKTLEDYRASSRVNGYPARDVALTFGPYLSPWDNGVHGARFGLLFAVPWIVLYLRDFLSGGTPDWQLYPLLAFAIDLLMVLLKWAAFGFIFGYFYPYLRGRNGMEKGLGLFLITVLPAIPLTALYNTSPGDWQVSLFWVLQIFIHSMLLGLVAFDYIILRNEGYDYQMLFQVHRITSIGVYASTILAAIGVAASTYLSSQVTDLVTRAFKLFIPPGPKAP